jgi:hypothetical protein
VLSGNALAELPNALFRIPGLVGLDLQFNNFSELSAQIKEVKQLRTLNVIGNRLRWLPAELLDLCRNTKEPRLRLKARLNPFVQPFSYVGYHNLILQTVGASDPQDSWSTGQKRTIVPWTMTELKRHSDHLRAILSTAHDGMGAASVRAVQTCWLLRLYEHFIAIPEMLWLDDVAECTKEEKDMLLARWGTSTEVQDSGSTLVQAVKNLDDSIGHALKHHTFLLAVSPICYLNISGRPIEPKMQLPSELPLDISIVPARLLAVPPPPVFANVGGKHIASLDALRPQQVEPPSPRGNGVRSLYASCLRSASSIPELPQLPELLPDDVSPSVRSGLSVAIQTRREGGRVCSACHRQYIIPRAEWIEYHHIHDRGNDSDINQTFLPFLRRVCSWACVPKFEFDD